MGKPASYRLKIRVSNDRELQWDTNLNLNLNPNLNLPRF